MRNLVVGLFRGAKTNYNTKMNQILCDPAIPSKKWWGSVKSMCYSAIPAICKREVFISFQKKITRAILYNNMGHTGIWRWLDTVFQGQYLLSLSVNYVTINKHLEKLPPVVLDTAQWNLSWSGLQWHPIGVVIATKWRHYLPPSLAAIFFGTGNCSYKIVHGSFFLQYGRLVKLKRNL